MTSQTQPELKHIPLNKLVLWAGNVRKTGASEELEALTANIAACGLLQPLVVKRVKGGRYAVIAGRRRFLALSVLADDQRIAKDAPVACIVMPAKANSAEISLAENLMRVPMHPADQFDAFRELADKGDSPADIAARFGITETAVKQRLRLARVSAVVFEAYRNEGLTLEQVQAFAVSDDHTAQERVFADLGQWNDSPRHIRDALTQGDIRATDKRARFVTLAAYEEAGGNVRRDLFANGDDGVFLLDAELLHRLAIEKLEAHAETIRAEGWKWVQAALEVDPSEMEFRERDPEPVPLSEEAEDEHRQLVEEYERLYQELPEDDERASARLDELQERIDALESTEAAYTAETLAIAGAIVTLGGNGEPRVLRGLVRPDDEPEGEAEPDAPKERPEHSAPLVLSLTDTKSAAISASLAQRPDVALAAVVHALASDVFRAHREDSSLQLSVEVTGFKEESKGASDMQLAREQWAERLPKGDSAMWEWCLTQDSDTLLELLAFCAASTLNAVQAKHIASVGRIVHANALAAALSLDMTVYFTPTAANYFSRVSRPTILKVLAEAKNLPAKRSWQKLKKSELAVLAEHEIAGTGWLPEPVRV
jgi:ParB family chromosome partitioning protein